MTARHYFVPVDDLQIFVREAGPKDGPVLLLLHGFPSASHQFRRLIDRLSDRVRCVALDYPGFGFSELPRDAAHRDRLVTFDGLSRTVERAIEALGLSRFFMYVFDYGAPIGFRIALRRPEWIAGIISQNGNAYEEGLGPAAARLRPGRTFDADAVRATFNLEATRGKYTTGAHDVERIAPESWILDQYFMDVPQRAEFLVRLLADYPSNIEAYPQWQAWLRDAQPPLLAAWGANDPIFIPAGAHAFLSDVPQARVELFDSGHFALDERLEEYAALIDEFLSEATSTPGARPTSSGRI